MTDKKQIKADKLFEKNLKDHVEKKSRKTLCISIRGSQVVFSGEENCVLMASENLENMTISELAEAMKGIINDSDGLSYKTSETVSFPAMKVKFKGRRWTLQAAREQLGVYMNILGFGRGGCKKYKEPADEPEGWPDAHSFVTFEHPVYATLDTINEIIESILDFHGVDAYKHPYTGEEPISPPRKKKRVAGSIIRTFLQKM